MAYGDPEYLVPSDYHGADPQKPKATDNIFGLAGFICALVALFVPLPTFLNILVWICAAGLSFLGIGTRPVGFAIAGLVIVVLSFLGWLLAVFFGAFVIGAGLSLIAGLFGFL